MEEDYHAEDTDKIGFNTSEIDKSPEFVLDEITEQSEGNVDRDIWKTLSLNYCELVRSFFVVVIK